VAKKNTHSGEVDPALYERNKSLTGHEGGIVTSEHL